MSSTNPAPPSFTIGELSRRGGSSADTIRYYERLGLMPSPPRTSGGHRLYSQRHVERLNFIRRSRQLALSLEQIRELLSRMEDSGYACSAARELLEQQLAETRSRIEELRALESSLKRMLGACGGADAASCAVIESMFSDREAASLPCEDDDDQSQRVGAT